uniref:Uncharacterized protein n=1 Tax=Lactuca sativa TaxID=4236 RepID=A0A9R1UDU2_LACSA|nr:hypothetical protein LSAT_V11C900492000 [Lactuca sativa]
METTYISCMNLAPSNEKNLIPLSAEAIPYINDNNDQMLDYICISLSSLIFSYIFFVSRVTSEKGLKVLIYYEEGCPTNKTKSYVYKELFYTFTCTFLYVPHVLRVVII